METPIPVPPPNTQPPGWRPTTSTAAGALLGGALAQVIVAVLTKVGWEPDLMTAGAINTLCVFGAGYLFPDGGRK